MFLEIKNFAAAHQQQVCIIFGIKQGPPSWQSKGETFQLSASATLSK